MNFDESSGKMTNLKMIPEVRECFLMPRLTLIFKLGKKNFFYHHADTHLEYKTFNLNTNTMRRKVVGVMWPNALCLHSNWNTFPNECHYSYSISYLALSFKLRNSMPQPVIRKTKKSFRLLSGAINSAVIQNVRATFLLISILSLFAFSKALL